jgi:hypothetical protein
VNVKAGSISATRRSEKDKRASLVQVNHTEPYARDDSS